MHQDRSAKTSSCSQTEASSQKDGKYSKTLFLKRQNVQSFQSYCLHLSSSVFFLFHKRIVFIRCESPPGHRPCHAECINWVRRSFVQKSSESDPIWSYLILSVLSTSNSLDSDFPDVGHVSAEQPFWNCIVPAVGCVRNTAQVLGLCRAEWKAKAYADICGILHQFNSFQFHNCYQSIQLFYCLHQSEFR